MFNFFKKKKQPLAIAAIFRNEKEYILEWLAWHISQGIEHYIIYDNESDDGTTELLQQLAAKNIIEFHTIPHQEKVQLIAYSEVLKQHKNKFELIAFIDADEFIMPMDDNTVNTHVTNLFRDKSIGALGINWRLFGSSGHKTKPNGHVLLNYQLASTNTQYRNHHLKSIYRPEAVINIFPHRATLKKGYRYINPIGKDITFATFDKTTVAPVTKNQTTGASSVICIENLRINHYVVKSYEEFLIKKKYRGDVMHGKDKVKNDSYFKGHDLNDEKVAINQNHLQAFTKQHQTLLTLLQQS